MLGKMRTKAKEILGGDEIRIVCGILGMVTITGVTFYAVGQIDGMTVGIEKTSKAIIDFVDACEKVSKSAL